MAPSQALQQRSLVREPELRRHQRVRVNLLGRFMLEDRSEYPCQTADMSPTGLALITPVAGRIGERVVAYIDRIGRIEGTLIRNLEGGFAIEINATPRKKDKLAATLASLASRHEANLPEDQRHEPVTASNPSAQIRLPDGREYRARLLEVSLAAAVLGVEVRPPIGTPITVGRLRAVVIRHSDEGIAVEFATVQTPDSIDQNLN